MRETWRPLPLTLVAGLLAAGLLTIACAGEPPGAPALEVSALLGGEPEAGFARVLAPRTFVFPDDHGSHPEFQTEWWYVTANLEDDEGRHYGVQLTFFRSALGPGAARPADDSVGDANQVSGTPSAWSEPQVYMAHAALTDASTGRFLTEERLSRPALDLAGARTRPFRVWLEDWELATVEGSGDGLFPLRLVADPDGARVELTLERGKPVVLQGDRGFSPKGPGPGDASHYYSYTRLPASGEIAVDGRSRSVAGSAWIDREWSTSVLGRNQVGWDWFALQLADGRDLMVFRLRASDGDDVRDGVLVGSDGRYRRLGADEFAIAELEYWTSPDGEARYPSRWRVSVPRAGIDVIVAPRAPDQEHRGLFRYWEGAVRLEAGGQEAGVGYVELTGYGASSSPAG